MHWSFQLLFVWLATRAGFARTPVAPPSSAATPPPATPSVRAQVIDRPVSTLPGWSSVPKSRALQLQAGQTYAALLEITGLESFASNALVVEKLREGARWTQLNVWSDVDELPATWPASREDASGRRWAIGVPAQTIAIAWPAQVKAVWVRR